MKVFRSHRPIAFRLAFLVLSVVILVLLMTKPADADAGQTLNIKLGEKVNRTWDDVKAANYAYGPKQDYDDATKETHIWLPYGSTAPFYEVMGMNMTDAGQGAALGFTVDGNTQGRFTYKLHFDQSIGAFRLSVGWVEPGLKNAAAGVEYSLDGQTWIMMKEIADSNSIVNQFTDPFQTKVGNLKTQDLYVRIYSRDKAGPATASAKSYWLKIRMSGDPTWGDASTTFFNSQLQLWATPAQ